MNTSVYPQSRHLMGPGPSDVHPRVLAAMANPTVSHLDPEFILMMDNLKDMLRYAFQTENELTIPLSGPASVGMESCFVNLIEPDDKVIVCQNGAFGGRMRENVERIGAKAVMVTDDWGCPVDPQKVSDALSCNPDTKAVAFVHAETSTGVQSDAATICAIARQNNALSIVDCVTSLAGSPVLTDKWEADAIYSGSQKCLSCTPGISPLTLSPRAVDVLRNRKKKGQSWFMDLNLLMDYWGEGSSRSYHHTAPINSLYGLHESLTLLQEEGIENAWQRHSSMHLALRHGIEALDLSFLVAENDRLPQLNTICIPDSVNEADVRSYLLSKYNLEVGAGLGILDGKVWRIGVMGQSAKKENIILFLSGLEDALEKQGLRIKKGESVYAAQRALGS
ncbi:MAG: alanine--glyoxylate aminotransferase [Rhodospirillaceae bacterium]|nr:alanine--glyoxylate aminotransferase [Rhodospirillaceae bacterium]